MLGKVRAGEFLSNGISGDFTLFGIETQLCLLEAEKYFSRKSAQEAICDSYGDVLFLKINRNAEQESAHARRNGHIAADADHGDRLFFVKKPHCPRDREHELEQGFHDFENTLVLH